MFGEANITSFIEHELLVLRSSSETGFKIPALLLILDSAVNFFNMPSNAWNYLMKIRSDYSIVSNNDFNQISAICVEIQQQLFPRKITSTSWIGNFVNLL